MQIDIQLRPKARGFHLITDELLKQLPDLPESGLLHLFLQHTSAGICINENADPSVRVDMEYFFDKNVPENDPGYAHTFEGQDDMPAHIKSVICGCELTIPIRNSKLALGTWQGVYLGEFRDRGGSRMMVATLIG